MTEVPEHLLKRSRDRRAALGLGGGDAPAGGGDTGAEVEATTTAAEKIYRSDGAPARIETRLTLAPQASLFWLPQETLIFEGAALERRLQVEMAGDASLILFESLVFGRLARGESRIDARLFFRTAKR